MVPPRLNLRSTERGVRDSINWAIISARMCCSVKFLDAIRTTPCGVRPSRIADPEVGCGEGEKLTTTGTKRPSGITTTESFRANRVRRDRVRFRLGSNARSTVPSAKSTSRARSAAGIAPRQIRRVLERASPRCREFLTDHLGRLYISDDCLR